MANPPMPARDAMIDEGGIVRRTWQVWFRNLTNTVDDAPSRIQTVSLVGQSASIGTTSIPSTSLTAGLYRVTWYLRITTGQTQTSLVAVDNASPVTYATTYSSSGAPAMQYALDITLEAVSV